MRGGALDSPIRIPGPPELASLALDIDAMRGYIRQQLVESERSRQAVEQSAAVVLTLRSELEPVISDMPDGWTVAGRLRAAEGVVAGDCYDLFATRSGEIALVVVDIAGHGATEGILALRCKEMLRMALTSGATPGEALETTAEILGDMGEEVFLTAFVAAIDTADGTVRYANAGHPPAYVVGDDVGGGARTDRSAGRPAGARVEDRRGDDGARRQPLCLHRRTHRDPQRRQRVLRSRTTGGAAPGCSVRGGARPW